MKMRKLVLNGVMGLGLAWFTGCSCSKETTKLQYMPDMADAPTVKTQEDYIDPPTGSVAMNAIIYPETPEEAEKVLKNPYPPNIDVIQSGKALFDTYCLVCHGPDAKGQGLVTDKFPPPPDITSKSYAERGDGFYFYRITFGSALMPGYGHAISPHERWQIVHYLRTLQGASK